MGEQEQAFAALEKARADQSEWMGWPYWMPALMRCADPRLADLVRRVGLRQ
ncbi:MAG: hypothetical protein U0Y68_19765 [Blastocatellia bacterium]